MMSRRALARESRLVRPQAASYSAKTVLLVAWVLLSVNLTACGLTAPRSSEGFANLDALGLADTDRVLTLSVGPALLRFAANHIDDEPETEALLRSLDGVRIRIYEIDGNAERVVSRMGGMSRKLQADGWEPVLLMRSDGEEAHMLVKVVDDRIRGMTVLVCDGESEAVVINLMGEIRPQQFGGVMAALDVEAAGVEAVRPADDAG